MWDFTLAQFPVPPIPEAPVPWFWLLGVMASLLGGVVLLVVRSFIAGRLYSKEAVDELLRSRDEALRGRDERIQVLLAITERDGETITTLTAANQVLAHAVSHLEENSEASLAILQALRPDRDRP